jgi:hypothetical protein
MCIDCAKGFHHGVSHVHVLYTDQINSLYCSLSPIPIPHYFSTAFSELPCATFIHNVFWHCPSPHHSLPLSLSPPPHPPDSPLLIVMFSHIYVYISMYISIYILGLDSAYDREHVTFFLLNLAHFT